ncbi:MAG: TolC family protein [Fibromonadales bacterium]|nr:TolC family protein [Fibromonadales bacterium]
MSFSRIALILSTAVCALFAQSYQNLTLQNCIEIAKKSSLSVASTRLTEKTAASALTQAKNARLPGLNGSADQDVVNGRPFAEPSSFDYLTALSMRLSSSMPIYRGDIAHSINRAEYNKEIAKLRSEAAERVLSEQVIKAYMQVWSLTESETAARASLALSKRMLARDSVLFNAGSYTASDLALSFAQAASDSLNLLQAQSNLTRYFTELRQLLEIPYGTAFSLSPPDSVNAEKMAEYKTLLLQAQENSINKKVDSLSILVADESIGIAKADRLPKINLSGGLSAGLYWKEPEYGTQLKTGFRYTATLGLSVPIIDWGATEHRILVEQVAKEDRQIASISTQKQLENAIEQLVLQVETYRVQWEVSSLQLEAGKLSLEKSVQQHELGMLDISSLVQQQTIFNNSQIKHNQAKYSYLLSKSLLDLQTGNF